MKERQRLVVVGAGMAAGKFVEELLVRAPARFDLTVIGEEAGGVYNRVKLINLLKAEDTPDFWTHPADFFRERGVRGVFGRPVTRFDMEKREVRLADNTIYPYDLLVLATGGVPFIPPVEGSTRPGVFALRNLADVGVAQEWLAGKSEVLVIGGGLLGLELALALKTMGKHVVISHLVGHLMEFQLCRDAGRILQRKLEGKGFDFIMDDSVTALEGDARGVTAAVFKSGRTLPVEAVFFNTGIRANTALAREAGLRVNKGIMVDDFLRTADPAVHAIGECCEHRGTVYGLVAPVWDQARVLAGVLAGEDRFYEGSAIPPTRLKSEFPVITMGRFHETPGDEVTVYEDPVTHTYKKLIVRKDRLVGANLLGEDLNVDAISVHYTAKMPVPKRRADLLFPGATAGDAVPVDAGAWPDDTPVCDCNGVAAGTIRAAINGGADTLSKVMAKTRAGTGCGNCKGKLRSLLVSVVGELKDDPAERYFVPGIPLERPALEALVRENGYRAVSAVLAHDPAFGDDAKTRMGLDYLLNYLHKGDYVVEYASKAVNDRYAGNIQKDGSFGIIPRVPGGKMDAGLLQRIADTAEKFGLVIKVTGADRIGLYSIDKARLPAVWQSLGADCGYAYAKTFRAAKSCVGSDFCRFGLGDSMGLGMKMDERYHGMTGPAKFKMGVSGCPRNCAEATIKDFGAVAVDGGWEVFIGGNGGARVRAADRIVRVKTEEEVIRIADRFYEYYRRHGRYLERTAAFVERLGLETVRDTVLHDTAENLAKLDVEFQLAVDAVRDPWRDPPDLENRASAPDAPLPGKPWLLCRTGEIAPGRSREFEIPGTGGDSGNTRIALFHLEDGRWLATAARCPHEQGPIVDSLYGAGKLNCPIHNNAFDIESGECTNPAVGKLAIYPVQIHDDAVSVLYPADGTG